MSGMFGGGGTNPYDEIVSKTTDENLTTENWELILNFCDKVQEEGADGARLAVASLLKRLSHRNPNVQLYTLSLTDALSKNVGLTVNREIASRAFTGGLEKLVGDRNTHEKVKKRVLALIKEWTEEWEDQEELGIMEECYEGLRKKNYKFDSIDEPPPPAVDDEIRRREEEELQRVLEMSMQDRGGYNGNSTYSSSSWSQPSGAGSSSSSTNAYGLTATNSTSTPAGAGSATGPGAVSHNGYVPSTNPSAVSSYARSTSPKVATPAITSGIGTMSLGSTTSLNSSTSSTKRKHLSNRVRALHAFTPTEPGELAFSAGDIITVVDRGYKDWWRGQLRGRTGIFPVNYVEVLPPPDEEELKREMQQEAAVFSEATNVERLLELLRDMDREQQEYLQSQTQSTNISAPAPPPPSRLADNDELQELYRSCMALRPKIVKLIEKYSQKRADLVSMNETFVRARTIFERLMEESLAGYGAAGGYSNAYGAPGYTGNPAGYPVVSPSYSGPVQPGYFPTPTPVPAGGTAGYPTGTYPQQPYPGGTVVQGPAQRPVQGLVQSPALGTPTSLGLPGQGDQPITAYEAVHGQPGHPQSAYEAMYGAQRAATQKQQATQGGLQQERHQIQGPVQLQQQQQVYGKQSGQADQAGQMPRQQQQQSSPQQQHPMQQPQLQPQNQTHSHSQSTQSQSSSRSQATSSESSSQPSQSAPPYIYSPTTTYTDPNVQAWAQYYAQGGTDPTGAVYFISVPGIKEGQEVQAETQEVLHTEQGRGGSSQGQGQSATRIATQYSQVSQSSIDNSHPHASAAQNQTQGQVQQGYGNSPYGASPYNVGSIVGGSASTGSLPYPGPASDSGHPNQQPTGQPSRSSTVDSTMSLGSTATAGSFPNPYSEDVENTDVPQRSSSLPYPGESQMPYTEDSSPSGLNNLTSPHSPHSPHTFQSTWQGHPDQHSQQYQQLQNQQQQTSLYRGVTLTDGPSPSMNIAPPTVNNNLSSFSSASTPSAPSTFPPQSSSPPPPNSQPNAQPIPLSPNSPQGPQPANVPQISNSTPSWVLPKIGPSPAAGVFRA
ncbi:hypothetical protein C8J55DRAFT_561221 [Lentinula edodes]|uniref:Class E vacuolar protein-sorting machinery protein HSE1 n=1 Tax=Lentinula lateritia TaxID=40482 RepID=A0A9W9DND8_9AGAR|nr:hypothetical protein C8J55DRAFT_561221 [Lentinula edodes]